MKSRALSASAAWARRTARDPLLGREVAVDVPPVEVASYRRG